MPKADDFIDTHIAADHALGQPRLKWLIDDAAARHEVRLAARHEINERHLFGHAPPERMQYANACPFAGRFENLLDLPDPLTAVAPVLFENKRAGRT